MVGDMRSHTRPAAPEQTGKHAAPTELGGHCGTCGYKHGAPNGAFRVVAAAPLGLKNACKVQPHLREAGAWLSSVRSAMFIAATSPFAQPSSVGAAWLVTCAPTRGRRRPSKQ